MKSFPVPLLDELRQMPEFDEAVFLNAHQQVAPTSIRLHPQKRCTLTYTDIAQVPWCGSGRYLQTRPVFTLDPCYHAGAYYVQEASSMFLHYLLDKFLPSKANLRVLDLCAAPGGKSTLLASLLDESSLLISNEVIRTRASILEENVVRWGYTNHWVTCNDAKDIGKLEEYFDVIVVDAPCSGSGLFRKDERAIDEWSENNVQLCSARQQRILADVWPSLKEDGILIYATCSYSRQEDEQILDWLAENFETTSLSIPLPAEWGITTVSSPKKSMTGYRFFPHRVNGEGFFIAAFRKKESTQLQRLQKTKTGNDKNIASQASWLLKPDDYVFLQGKEQAFAIYPNHEHDFQLIHKQLYLRKIGLPLGAPAAKNWIPAHEVALSIDKSSSISTITLNREQALLFLKKDELQIDAPKGWHLVTFDGLSLGWIKSIGNRMNNYLPKHWRIRMQLPDEDWA